MVQTGFDSEGNPIFTAAGNAHHGVELEGVANSTVGGTATGASNTVSPGNVISANDEDGVLIAGGSS